MFKPDQAHKDFVRDQLLKYGKGRDSLPYTDAFAKMRYDFEVHFCLPKEANISQHDYWLLICSVCKQGLGKKQGKEKS